MLFDAVVVLAVAVAIGLGLAAIYLRGDAAPRLPLWPGMTHGLLGIIGTGVLLFALGGPPRGVASGAGSFGQIAAWFCGIAIAFGAIILAANLRRRKAPALALVVHAMLGVAGFIMLLAFYAAGP